MTALSWCDYLEPTEKYLRESGNKVLRIPISPRVHTLLILEIKSVRHLEDKIWESMCKALLLEKGREATEIVYVKRKNLILFKDNKLFKKSLE